MNLKNRVRRIQAKTPKMCLHCGTDLDWRDAQLKSFPDWVRDRVQRLISEGWTEEEAKQIVLEAAPMSAPYLK